MQTCSFSQPTYGRFDGLYLVEPRRLAMVQTALDALPPRRGGPLRTLTIVNGFFEATVQWEWQELAQLHSLSLIGCSGAVDAALAGLLTQAHELSLLALVAVPATTLPQGAYLKSESMPWHACCHPPPPDWQLRICTPAAPCFTHLVLLSSCSLR